MNFRVYAFILSLIVNLLFSQEYKIQFSHIPTGQGVGQNDSVGVMSSIGAVLSNKTSSDSFKVGIGFLNTTQSVFSDPPLIANFILSDIIVKNSSPVLASVTLSDLNGIGSAILELQVGGDSGSLLLPMSLVSPGEYEATLSDTLVDIQNFRGRVIGTDNLNFSTVSEYKVPEIRFNNRELSMAKEYSHYPEGIQKEIWRLVSWPGLPNNTSLAASDLENGHAFYSWKSVKKEFFQPSSIELGRAYWFKHKYDDPVIFSEDTSTAISLEDYIISLKPGWNLIGSPFFFPVEFAKGVLVGEPITYGQDGKGGWSSPQDKLIPWNGYAVYAADTSRITLYPFPQEDTSASRIVTSKDWSVNLKIETDYFINHASEIGRRENANNKYDIYDTPQLPNIKEGLSLLMDLDGNSDYAYTKDIRDIDELNGVWNLRIDGEASKNMLVFSGETRGSIPEELNIAIVDIQERSVFHDILDKGKVINKNNRFAYDLKLIAGDLGYVEMKTQEILDNIPNQFSLGQNYPNPFNPITKMNYALPIRSRVVISIYNVLGQEVVTILDQVEDYGYHTVSWNGTDDYGRPMASGVYFARMMTDTFTKTKKMLLLK